MTDDRPHPGGPGEPRTIRPTGTVAAKVVVAGASGFAGALAAHLVWRHPRLELGAVTARSDVGARLDDLYPHYRVPLILQELDPDRIDSLAGLDECDAAIIAYPHGVAAPAVAALRERGLKVVDLSADFRLDDHATYEEWYGEHGAPELFGEAVYGLPELHRERIAGADLVANPGCYPTAAILALAPLAGAGLLGDIVIDAKSGASGAGRGGGTSTHFVTVDENVSPYAVDGHRHHPEIAQELAGLGGDAPLTFVPHLLPLDQGELVSCYVRPGRETDAEELVELYRERYEDEPFIELADRPPGVRDVRATNICRIAVGLDERGGRIMVFASIDNLWKGAASQAIQNLNLMLGLPEGEGIE